MNVLLTHFVDVLYNSIQGKKTHSILSYLSGINRETLYGLIQWHWKSEANSVTEYLAFTPTFIKQIPYLCQWISLWIIGYYTVETLFFHSIVNWKMQFSEIARVWLQRSRAVAKNRHRITSRCLSQSLRTYYAASGSLYSHDRSTESKRPSQGGSRSTVEGEGGCSYVPSREQSSDVETGQAGFPTRAQMVVCGGGAVGCSVALHLAKDGATDVHLLEQGR